MADPQEPPSSRFRKYGKHVRVHPETHAALIEFCDRVNRPIAEVVREAIEGYLTAHHKDRRKPPPVAKAIETYPQAHLTTAKVCEALGLRPTPANIASVRAALEEDGRWEERMRRWPPGHSPRKVWVPAKG